jgi:hypothetical protein
MRIVVPGATAENAQRYLIAAACGAALAFASLAGGYGSRDMATVWVIGVAAGMLVCISAGFTLVVGAYRRAKAVRETGEYDRITAAAKRQQLLNAAGALILFATTLLMWPHAFFGAPTFAGQWAVEFIGIFTGLIIQLHSQARYLKELG